jgi:hypothetical protein
MSFGFAEAISLLLALGGLGVDANPKAPGADAVLEHSVDDADVVVHFDAAAVVPRNYKVLADLGSDKAVQASPELRDMARQLSTQIEGARGMAKGMLGLDPMTDVSSVTLFLRLKPGGANPDGLVVVRGKIPQDIVTKVSTMTGSKVETVDGRAATLVDGENYVGTSKSGALLFGTTALVKPRIANAWKAAPRAKTAPLARLTQLLDSRPFFATYVRPSPALVKELTSGEKNVGADLVAGLEVGTMGLHHDGMSWTWTDKTDAGARRARLASEGVVELMRAAQIAPRGLAKIAVASLDSYAGTSKEIDVLIQRKNELLALVGDYTGDGRFKAAVGATGRVVTVRLTGKKVSKVVPVGILVPAVAAGLYFQAAEPPPPPPLPPAQVKPTKPVRPVPGKPVPGKPAPKPTKPQPRKGA